MDLLSSPDPLNASLESAITPSYTRRVTRSQTSSRFASIAGSSPRKQTFELDVGNAASPQKLLVTVEAEEADKENVSRRLFGTPTPKRSVRRRETGTATATATTTTTTVPLKGLTDDESAWRDTDATPRRRGRPPKSGTPSTQSRKKTPAKPRLTPGRPRRARSTTDELLGSEISVATDQSTPKASTRTRKTAKRKNAALATDDEQTEEAAPPKRRGRNRRQALAPEDVVVLEDHISDADASSMRSNSMQPDTDMASEGGVLESISVNGDARMEDDIWMGALRESQQSVRRTRSRRQRDTTITPSPPHQAEPDAVSLQQATNAESNGGDANEYMQFDDHSDLESNVSENPSSHRRDQDTIVDGENFTMISMDSVPSFQAQLHMQTSDLPEIGETTSLIINKTLESLRQSVVVEEEAPEKQQDGEKTPLAIPPAKSTTSIQDNTPRANNSLPTPSVSRLSPSRSPRRNRGQPLSRQLALKSLQQDDNFRAEEIGRSNTSPNRANVQDVSIYEDSFSEIPEAVLEAATPRRPTAATEAFEMDVTEELEAEREVQEFRAEQYIQEEQDERPMTSHSSHSVLSHAESSRLPTPDETPSPNDESPENREKHAASRMGNSEPNSSPPAFGRSQVEQFESTSRLFRQASTATPKAVVSTTRSRSAEAPLPQEMGLAPPSSGSRPALSPIVRVGRTLQSIMSDPPSPPAGGSVLGSPFQGSQRKSSPIAVDEPSPATNKSVTPPPAPLSANHERSWSKMFAPFSQLKNLVVQGAQTFSPRAQSSQMLEDPFGPSSSKPLEVSGNESVNDTQELGNVDHGRDSKMSIRSSMRNDLRSEDEMSWVADSNPFVTTKSFSQSGDSSYVDKEPSFVSHSLTTHEVESLGQNAEDNEQDIWAVEAQRPTPAFNQTHGLQEQAPISPTKGELSNIWGTRSTTSIPREFQSEHSMIEEDQQPPESPVQYQEEYSLLSLPGVRDGQTADTIKSPARPELAKPKRVDLSAFFSSSPGLTTRFGQSEGQKETQPMPMDGVSSRLGVNKAATATGGLTSVPQKHFAPNSEHDGGLFSANRPSQPMSDDALSHSLSPATPERPVRAQIPQKRNFTPLLGQGRPSLFAPSPVVYREDDAAQMDDDSDEDMHEFSRMTHEIDFEQPALKPLPDRSASPTKSCMRSPLKPKTPGRVVEFTSSTLSPLAQAQTRAEKQNQVLLGSSISNQARPEPVVVARENPRPGLNFSILATPKHRHLQQKQVDSPLSQSQWTKKHWIRLDGLLQQYRRAPLEFQLKYGGVTPQKRKSSMLLGKQVTSQGETMLLEQWHLDIVDAFKKEVGGWDESELAKRLFAVMVGEERRRLGLVPKRR